MITHSKKIALVALMSGAAVASTSAASAQAIGFSTCATMASAACIEQIGGKNYTSINQEAAKSSTAVASSDGISNTVTITQKGTTNVGTIGVVGSSNNVALTQDGQTNRAVVAIRGSQNGSGGTIGFNRNAGIQGNLKSETPLFAFPSTYSTRTTGIAPASVPSGVINQTGQGNAAGVAIFGNNNDFHVTQKGNSNAAVQGVSGANNDVAAVQGVGTSGVVGNQSVQLQLGIGNSAYVEQNGNFNKAVQVQAGPGLSAIVGAVGALATIAGNNSVANSAEAALANMSSGGNGSNNQIVLQQNGSGNEAALAQFGTGNKIALAQPGDAFASITQIGNNHSIGIDQRSGVVLGFGRVTSPITVVQY